MAKRTPKESVKRQKASTRLVNHREVWCLCVRSEGYQRHSQTSVIDRSAHVYTMLVQYMSKSRFAAKNSRGCYIRRSREGKQWLCKVSLLRFVDSAELLCWSTFLLDKRNARVSSPGVNQISYRIRNIEVGGKLHLLTIFPIFCYLDSM